MTSLSRFQKIMLGAVVIVAALVVIFLYPHSAAAPSSTIQEIPKKPLPTTTIYIKDKVIKAFIANTIESMTLGLGKRASLPDGEGMWFEFGSKSKWGIWMKDMQFPIDIIWVDEDMRIVSIAEKISPDTYPKVFYPSLDATFVLEVPSGFVENSQIEVGNTLSVR